MEKVVKITMYKWAGKKFGITIKTECKECEINTAILKDMKEREFRGLPVMIEIRPWLSNLWEALRLGGWRAPVVLVDGKLFSQGRVIERERLKNHIFSLFGK